VHCAVKVKDALLLQAKNQNATLLFAAEVRHEQVGCLFYDLYASLHMLFSMN